MNKIYYDIADDIKAYPDAWLYIVMSGRGPGKTYSSLKYAMQNNKKFCFLKRTIDDVNLMCKRASDSESDGDVSPFVPINRDLGTCIKPVKVSKGYGAFYPCELIEDKYTPSGDLIGWVTAVSMIEDVKGFNMLPDLLIFDEFCPKPWERINRKEGDAILDLYETLSRDRVKRGEGELKFIATGNTVNINAPLLLTLELIDDVVEMKIKGEEYRYIDGILIHLLSNKYTVDQDNLTGIQRRMMNTKWGKMAYKGDFGYNDFSHVGKISIKGYIPLYGIIHGNTVFYVYRKGKEYYITLSAQKVKQMYDLNIEQQQKEFYLKNQLTLLNAFVNDNVHFETYTAYDLILNYKKYYNV